MSSLTASPRAAQLVRRLVPLALAGLLTLAPRPAAAQSADVHSPSPLKAGKNHAVSDSFGTDQFWTFTAQPGAFHLVFTREAPKEGFSLGKAGAGAVFAPQTPGAVLNFKDTPTGVVFDGSVKEPTRVIILVEPAKSPLVKQTVPYTLEATGKVSFAGGK